VWEGPNLFFMFFYLSYLCCLTLSFKTLMFVIILWYKIKVDEGHLVFVFCFVVDYFRW
jgi:hypothetical protein